MVSILYLSWLIFNGEKMPVQDNLKAQIGNYDPAGTNVQLSESAKKSLYKAVNKYQQKKPESQTATFHRDAFIDYLFSDTIQGKDGLNEDTRNDYIRKGKAGDAAVIMEDLLGPEGVKLYKAALVEERFSKEFMDATLRASTKHYEGPKFTKRFATPISAASATGKSYTAKYLIDINTEFMPKDEENQSGNDVVSIDGGIAREISQIRKLALQFAIKKNYTGIKDLQDQSVVLRTVKKDILETAFVSPELNMLLPETFSKLPESDKLIKRLQNLPDTIVTFSRIVGNDKSFMQTVKFNGEARAWKTDATKLPDEYDLNIDSKLLPESKAYDAGVLGLNFKAGEFGSKKAEQFFRDVQENGLAFIVFYDLMLLKENASGEWEPVAKGGPGVKCFSRRIYEEWKNLPAEGRESLEDYSDEKRKTLGAIIVPQQQDSLLKTTCQLEASLQGQNKTNLQPVVDAIKTLGDTWKQSNWAKYQDDIDGLREQIKVCFNAPSLPDNVKEKLDKIYQKLEKARQVVPQNAKKALPDKEVSLMSRPLDEFIMSDEDALEFKHKVVDEENFKKDLPANLKTSEQEGNKLQTSEGMQADFKGVKLENNQCIQSYVDFGDKKYGLLKQNHRGTVIDMSSSDLDSAQKTRVAMEQAQMLLINWRPGSGNIIIRGQNSDMANKVYAALLFLKHSHPALENIVIKSHVANCTGPKKSKSAETQFINQHLGSEKKGALPKDLREAIKDETAESIRRHAFFKQAVREEADPVNAPSVMPNASH